MTRVLFLFLIVFPASLCRSTEIVVTESPSPGTPVAASSDGEYVAYRIVGGVLGQFDETIGIATKDSVTTLRWKRFYNDAKRVSATFIDDRSVLVGSSRELDLCDLRTGKLTHRFSEPLSPMVVVNGNVVSHVTVDLDNFIEELYEIQISPVKMNKVATTTYIGHSHKAVYDADHKNIYCVGDYGTFRRINMVTYEVSDVAKSVGTSVYGRHFRDLELTHNGWLLALTPDGIMKIDTRLIEPPREYDKNWIYDIDVPRIDDKERLKGLGFITTHEFWVATTDALHILSWPECQVLKSHRISPLANDNPKRVPRTIRSTLNVPNRRMALLYTEREDLFIVQFPMAPQK